MWWGSEMWWVFCWIPYSKSPVIALMLVNSQNTNNINFAANSTTSGVKLAQCQAAPVVNFFSCRINFGGEIRNLSLSYRSIFLLHSMLRSGSWERRIKAPCRLVSKLTMSSMILANARVELNSASSRLIFSPHRNTFKCSILAISAKEMI